jgi:hypothetical protein
MNWKLDCEHAAKHTLKRIDSETTMKRNEFRRASAVAFLSMIAIALAIPSNSEKPSAKIGPFGFCFGESKEQVIAAVGKDAVLKTKGNEIDLSTAPRPHKGIEMYVLFIVPGKGLLEVSAIGNNIDTNDAGDQLQVAFHQVEAGLISAYGTPQNKFDALADGSIWNESRNWMMGLVKQDRSLGDSWIVDKESLLPNRLMLVDFNAIGIRRDVGRLRIDYEAEGWGEYVDQEQAKQDGVL